MSSEDFVSSLSELVAASPTASLDGQARYVFLSDLHMGDGGKRDDLEPNRGLALAALARWYLERGYALILGGDVEDLQKFSLPAIRRAWGELYELFDAFSERGALWKLVGNHDLSLLREADYPYPLYHGLRLERGERSLFCFHGHQASKLFSKHNYLSGFVVRYLAKPFKVKNSSVSGDSRKRFKAERRIYRASKEIGMVSICGHTHRPLFESLSKYDSLRWSIEELLRRYPTSDEEGKARIAELVGLYRGECERLGRDELRWDLSKGLYEDKALLIPCVFNSGCATGKNGITALEIEGGDSVGGKISLVHWAKEGRSRAYIGEEALLRDRLDGCDATRYLLKQSGLDQVFARIDLLGK
jgi:UDP-2,3-diacylglucosamine pyrophosphatase LpxH